MKKFIALALLLAVCLSLVACASEEKIAVTWIGIWNYNGNSFVNTITMKDGTYTSLMLKNGKFHETESDTYEIKGNNVDLHPNGEEGHTTPFKYKGGNLYNGDNEFIKQ